MSELALAAFAAATDSHVVREPKELKFRRFARAFDEGSYLAELEANGYRFLGRSDDAFPALVRELHDPPPGLFLRGEAEAELLSEAAVAIVGARSCSSYGRQVARQLGRELAGSGLAVVSGMARGVDAEDHERVGILVRRDDELSGRVDPEVAGGLAAGGLEADRGELARRGLDREDRQCVVAL